MSEDYAQFKIRVHENDTETIAQIKALVSEQQFSKTVIYLLRQQRKQQ